MRDDTWTTIGAVPPAELVDATLELHWAAQIVAASGQTFAEPRSDDSHRAMTWDRALRALVGSAFEGPYPFRLSLRPEDLTLVLVDRRDEPLGSLPLSGVTLDQAHDWLALGLATYMGVAPPPIQRPEYDMPEHAVGAGAPFSATSGDAARALTALYGGAAELLGELISTREDASPVRCWPHHFDVATLITLEAGADGTARKTVGAGMAPMGGGYDRWYWYVSPWPYPEPSALPELGGPGAWHTEGWTGAVLTGEALVAAPAEFREAVVRKFLDVSVEAATAALSG